MNTNVVCVIGAGVAGLTAANACAENGILVTLIERNPYPGGRSVSYGCKATDTCVQCGVCLIRDALEKNSQHQNIRRLFSAEITSVRRNRDGSFRLDVECSPNPIDPETCVNCGNCLAMCRQHAISRIPGWGFYVDDSCDRCGECTDSCGFDALSFDRPVEQITLEADQVIIASGFDPYDPKQNRKWGYGSTPRLITGTELEGFFHDESFVPPELAAELSDGEHRVAFVQCVGSRNAAEGIESCSRVCCAYALRMADRLCEEYPEIKVDLFYMDLQYFGKSYESFMEETRKRIRLIRSNPISVTTDAVGRPIVRFDSMVSDTIEENTYDFVVLSHGMTPANSSTVLARQFGLNLSPEGFFHVDTAGDPERLATSTVHVCGAAEGPMGIAESVGSALQVAGTVAVRLREMARSAP